MLRYRLRESTRTPFPCPEDMNPTLHALLVQRGIASADEARRFLHPKPEHLHDPFLLNDMGIAVERISKALSAGEPICVYGDYDVDGVSASSLLSDYLRSRGAQVEVYLPSRHNEGYGLNDAAIRSIAERNRLMITVDCGVTSVELIALAKSLGLDCIVTDHHQPAEILPDCPVINPLLNGYPFPALCGAGVAFKLVHALGGLDAALEYVDIAALATVADVVSLTDENRVIVKLGLERINKAPRPGIKALIDVSGMTDKKISAGNIAFQLAPRLNAGGRIGSARRSYDLLLSPTLPAGQPIAEELEQENTARKDIEQQILADAEKQLEGFDFPAHRALVVSGEGWNSGVIGLAASRLVEKYHYPVILLAEHDGVMTGSCRSIPGVDIHAALTAVQQHLIRYGGHKQAAGLTLKAENLDVFRRDLNAWLFENIPPVCYIPEQEYDMDVHFDELTEAFVAGLEALQPTGFGNPAPALRAAPFVYEQRAVGADGAHLRLLLSEHSVQRTGIFFRAGNLAGNLPETVDILFSPKLNTYMGRTSVQVELKSLKSGDAMSEISAKIADEEEILQEFLTEILYNKRINPDKISAQSLTSEQLRQMLLSSPQGTLILTGDLRIAQRLLSPLGDAAPDVFIGAAPDDPRAFNALCACPPAELPGHYRRVVLAGMPAGCAIPANCEVFRMDETPDWFRELPDLDRLRLSYKTARVILRSTERWDSLAELIHLFSVKSQLSFTCCTACVLALHDMKLAELTLGARPCGFKLNEMHKTDPETSAVWRAIQAWRNEP